MLFSAVSVAARGASASCAPTPTDKLRGAGGAGGAEAGVVLLACGSFNPPTLMHLRMFELARAHLERRGQRVLGGYMSPVSDAYGKAGLVGAAHRLEMCRRAASHSSLLMVSAWEAQAAAWQPTLSVVRHVQGVADAALGGAGRARVMLLCGADLVETFRRPGLWNPDDMRALVGDFGIACVDRQGSDALRTLQELPELRGLEAPGKGGAGADFARVHLVEEPVDNQMSSTQLRAAIARGLPVRYLTMDGVVDYIEEAGLYADPPADPAGAE